MLTIGRGRGVAALPSLTVEVDELAATDSVLALVLVLDVRVAPESNKIRYGHPLSAVGASVPSSRPDGSRIIAPGVT